MIHMVEYSRIENSKDIGRINRMIRSQLKSVKKRDSIIKLMRQSQYLVTLTYTPAWKKKYNVGALRRRAKFEYNKTKKMANKKLLGMSHGKI